MKLEDVKLLASAGFTKDEISQMLGEDTKKKPETSEEPDPATTMKAEQVKTIGITTDQFKELLQAVRANNSSYKMDEPKTVDEILLTHYNNMNGFGEEDM